MVEIRSRTRSAPKEEEGRPIANPTLLKTGAQAEAARTAEAQRQESMRTKRNQPWRVWVPFSGEEEKRTVEFIMLDNSSADCPVFYEHALPDPNNDGKLTLHEVCIKEVEHCPLCEKYGDSYYVQMFSVITLLKKPIVTKDGRTISHSKRLLPVKFPQQEWFKNMSQDTFAGNMRGAHIVTIREESQRSPAIGTPQLCIDEDQKVVQYTEDQLVEGFSHPDILNQQGNVVRKANSDLYPYNYAELFPTPAAEDLRRRFGGVVPAGSSAEVKQAWSNGDSGTATIQRRAAPAADTSKDDYLGDLDDEIPF